MTNTYLVIPADSNTHTGCDGLQDEMIVRAVCPEDAIRLVCKYFLFHVDDNDQPLPFTLEQQDDSEPDFWKVYRFPALDGVNEVVEWDRFDATCWKLTPEDTQ